MRGKHYRPSEQAPKTIETHLTPLHNHLSSIHIVVQVLQIQFKLLYNMLERLNYNNSRITILRHKKPILHYCNRIVGNCGQVEVTRKILMHF